MKYNLIGAGRLGKNIAKALSTPHLASLNAVCNRSIDSARQACNDLGFGSAVSSIAKLPPADVTWITCNDDAIGTVVCQLSQLNILKPGSLIIHCSGALNSTVLAPLKEQGCYIASFHPLKAFGASDPDSQAFQQIHCIIEGDVEACRWLQSTFEELKANLVTIPLEGKASYHAAATIASNYLITLAFYSEQLLLQAGVPSLQSKAMICNLMQGNINNLNQRQPVYQALTGPLERGDISTISCHLEAITDSTIKNLYKTMGLFTLPITPLSEEKKSIISALLQ